MDSEEEFRFLYRENEKLYNEIAYLKSQVHELKFINCELEKRLEILMFQSINGSGDTYA